MGTAARSAEPELREALKDKWLNVREAAEDALKAFESNSAPSLAIPSSPARP